MDQPSQSRAARQTTNYSDNAMGLNISESEIMQILQSRIHMKRDTMAKWRDRYSKQEYPVRMVSNFICTDILNGRLVKKSNHYFQPKTKTHIEFLDAIAVTNKDQSHMHNEVAMMVDDRKMGKIATLEPEYTDELYEKINMSSFLGHEGINEEIEKLEFNWVYGALKTDLIQLWLTFGLCGLSRTEALKRAFYFISYDSNMVNEGEIKGVFHDLSVQMLNVPGAYRPMPPLW